MPPLRSLLVNLEQGYYMVPEVQRGFVWRNEQVKELMNSIYNRLPIGSIITWEVPMKFKESYGDLFEPLIDELADKAVNGRYLVIDGQQRLISLLLAKKGSITKMGSTRRINLYFCVDLSENSGSFKVARGKELEQEKYCFNSEDILSSETDIEEMLDKKKLEGSVRKSLRNILSNAREHIMTYEVPVIGVDPIVLERYADEEDVIGFLEKLSDMFVKLNTQGVRIKMSELIIAILTPTAKQLGKSFRDLINEIDDELERMGWDISEAVYMRLLITIATGNTKFKEAKDKLRKLDYDSLKKHLDSLSESVKRSVELLRGFNIKNESELLSRYSLVTLGYYIHIVKSSGSTEDPKKIRKWLIASAFNRRYTGRLETDLYEDMGILAKSRDIGSVASNYRTKSVDAEYFNSKITKEHEQILRVLLADAYDFTGSKKLHEINDLTIHHIFPKKFLTDYYKDSEIEIGGYRFSVEELHDHVGNITFISKQANSSIRDQNPSVYLPKIPESIRESHYIPINPELYKIKNYVEFIKERIELIKSKVDEALR